MCAMRHGPAFLSVAARSLAIVGEVAKSGQKRWGKRAFVLLADLGRASTSSVAGDRASARDRTRVGGYGDIKEVIPGGGGARWIFCF